MPKLDWSDYREIGIALYEKYPGLDPLQVRFTDLRDKIAALEDFAGDVRTVNEKKLEAVQMAWHEEWADNRD